jgi:succinate dehydrogenase hydrophobic anchor subunit
LMNTIPWSSVIAILESDCLTIFLMSLVIAACFHLIYSLGLKNVKETQQREKPLRYGLHCLVITSLFFLYDAAWTSISLLPQIASFAF